MSYRGGYPFTPPGTVPYGDGSKQRAAQQAGAEFREAQGQLQQAEQLYGFFDRGGSSSLNIDKVSKELAAHKIREAITNLQDVVRFMELP